MGVEPRVTVVREDILSEVAQQLIRSLNAELSDRYPEEGATHFRLHADEVAEGRGAFLVAYLGSTPVGCGAVRAIGEAVGEVQRGCVSPALPRAGGPAFVFDSPQAPGRRPGRRGAGV